MANSVLDMVNATPQEKAALQQIAMMRAAGIPDEQIFSQMTIGGGYEYLPFVSAMAGINSSYNLGRGSLAEGQQRLYYDQVRDPYNVVAATQFMRDTGASPMLTDPILGQVQASPAARYGQFIDEVLFPGTTQAGGTATPGAAGGAPPNATGQAWVDAWRAYHPGEPDPVPGYAMNGTATGATEAAAQNLAPTLPGMSNPTFRNALSAGDVPGFSSANVADVGKMSSDQRDQWFGMVGSKGRTSDPRRAYADFLRTYDAGGSSAGGTAR